MFEHTTQLRKSSEDGMRRSSFPETAGLEDMIHLVRDEELFASLGFSCSNCHKAPPDLKEWFVCRDCMDIALDPQCLVDRREESCGPGHSHMRLSLSDVKHCRSGNGEQLSDVTQWVRDLQREWMLDKPALRTFDDVLTLTLGVMAAKRIWKERKYGRNVSSVASSRLIPLATLLERPDIVGFKGRSG